MSIGMLISLHRAPWPDALSTRACHFIARHNQYIQVAILSRITPNVRPEYNDLLGSPNLGQPLYDRLDFLRGDLPSWFGGCQSW